MEVMNATRKNLLANNSAPALTQLRFASLDALTQFSAQTAGVDLRFVSGGSTLKRANFDVKARNVVASAATPHTVIEDLYVVRPYSLGDYAGKSDVFYELQRAATLTWSFTAGAANEIPLAQLPAGDAYLRLSAPSSVTVASSQLLENEANAPVLSTPLTSVGAIVHVQHRGATVGYVRHFRSMNLALIEGVLPLSQLFA